MECCSDDRQGVTHPFSCGQVSFSLNIWCAMQTPRVPLPPAYREGWKLQDDQPVTRELYDTMVDMIDRMNRAVDDLPELQAVR